MNSSEAEANVEVLQKAAEAAKQESHTANSTTEISTLLSQLLKAKEKNSMAQDVEYIRRHNRMRPNSNESLYVNKQMWSKFKPKLNCCADVTTEMHLLFLVPLSHNYSLYCRHAAVRIIADLGLFMGADHSCGTRFGSFLALFHLNVVASFFIRMQ